MPKKHVAAVWEELRRVRERNDEQFVSIATAADRQVSTHTPCNEGDAVAH